MEKQLAKAQASGDPQKIEAAGQALTYARLVKSHEGGGAVLAQKGIQHLLGKDPEHIERLRKLTRTPGLDPSLAMKAGEVVTKYELEKSRLSEDSARTQAAIDAILANPAVSASLIANKPYPDSPEGGHLDTSTSGTAGSVTAGVKPKASMTANPSSQPGLTSRLRGRRARRTRFPTR